MKLALPQHAEAMQGSQTVHSSQSSLFIDSNDPNLWAEMEIETARAKSSRVVLQTRHQKEAI